MGKYKDLTGKRFGKLVAIECVRVSQKVLKWKCLCDCGNYTFVSAGCLNNGSTKSCGCAQIKDLTGMRFGKLVAEKIVGKSKSGSRKWLCKCDCGNETVVDQYHLSSGHTKSCGCINKELKYIHGLSRSRIYKIYKGMKTRCYHKECPEYSNYGGRGIKICDEWLDEEKGFLNFYNWSNKNGYSEQLTIDRIDVNGNYEPSNCRWVNRKVQMNNTRRNDFIEYNGEVHTLSEWAELYGIGNKTLFTRIHRLGWDIHRALNEPIHKEFSHRKKVVK